MQNENQANIVQNGKSDRLIINQDQENQKQPIQQQQQEKPKALPRKMDLSEYDTANDDIISVSNAPESAVTSDERVKTKHFSHLFVSFPGKIILNYN